MAMIIYTKFVNDDEFFITPYKDLLFGIQEGKADAGPDIAESLFGDEPGYVV